MGIGYGFHEIRKPLHRFMFTDCIVRKQTVNGKVILAQGSFLFLFFLPQAVLNARFRETQHPVADAERCLPMGDDHHGHVRHGAEVLQQVMKVQL